MMELFNLFVGVCTMLGGCGGQIPSFVTEPQKKGLNYVFLQLLSLYRVFPGNRPKVYCLVQVASPEIRQVVNFRLDIDILIFSF